MGQGPRASSGSPPDRAKNRLNCLGITRQGADPSIQTKDPSDAPSLKPIQSSSRVGSVCTAACSSPEFTDARFPDSAKRSFSKAQRFRGGLVFKAHRLVYHSTLGSRIKKKKKLSASTKCLIAPFRDQHISRFPGLISSSLLSSLDLSDTQVYEP